MEQKEQPNRVIFSLIYIVEKNNKVRQYNYHCPWLVNGFIQLYAMDYTRYCQSKIINSRIELVKKAWVANSAGIHDR